MSRVKQLKVAKIISVCALSLGVLLMALEFAYDFPVLGFSLRDMSMPLLVLGIIATITFSVWLWLINDEVV